MEPEGPTEAAPPPVVAVVVTRNPGAWLDEVMGSLAAQDYPNLSTLVIDAASDDDPTPRLARLMPGAYVRRLEANPGYGAAANEVLDIVDGAAFYLFCHDDVALEPDAVRTMVEEAFRSNAAIVGPKLVSWTDPRRLLQVGEAVDKLGTEMPLVDRGELDQEQHDAVRDVFAVPGGCTLVRADLFAEVGGFDEGITFLLDDVSLCWRSHVAGGRVLVAPAARVRHLEALGLRRHDDDRRRLQARHRLRITLTCYSRLSLVRVLPQAALLAVVEVLYSVLVGHTAQARDVASAWAWNARRLADIRVARAHLRGFRRVRDAEIRRFQTRGFARITLFLRGQIGRGNDDRLASMARSGRELAGSLQSGTVRTAIAVWGAVVLVLAIGSRHLVVQGVPAIGELVPLEGGPLDLLREYASGWRRAGLGSEAPAPTGLGVFGVLGVVAGGALGLVRTVLVVGMLPLGAVAAHRLARPAASRRGRLVAVVAYLAIPLPYNAIAQGEWGVLVAWAAMPLLLARLARAGGIEPYGQPGAQPIRRHAVAVGLVVALVAIITPVAPLLAVATAVVLVAGSAAAGHVRGSARVLLAGAGAALVAAALHVPWTFDFVTPGATWGAVVGAPDGAGAQPLAELLRFQTGPLGASPVGWAFLAVGALPLLIGRAWRFDWAVRSWVISLAAFGAAWAAERGSWPVDAPDTALLLLPAAAALALCAALGVTAFELDLPGYRFGWRQLAAGLALVALVAGASPVLGAAFDGRWSTPAGDHRRALARVAGELDAPYRMLWLGDPDVLPLGSWEMRPGLAYATSDDGTPGASALWPGSDDGATRLLADAIAVAERGDTVRLGRLLAPMGVRFVVVTTQRAPAPFTDEERPVPTTLLDALAQQLDLEALDVNPALVVYRNLSYAPTRALVPDGTGSGDDGIAQAVDVDLSGAEAVLEEPDGFARWSGELAGGDRVLLAAAASDAWELQVDGEPTDRSTAFGWANAFDVDRDGAAELRFETAASRYGLLAAQVVLWLLAIRVLLRMRLGPREAAG